VSHLQALVTTFGVGELSAVNGIAGSYSEMIPVIHIVGMPDTKSQAAGAVLHHTLGNGDFQVFRKIYSEITVANTILKEDTAMQEIDRVIRHCIVNVRPGMYHSLYLIGVRMFDNNTQLMMFLRLHWPSN
jgi:pyruvate decarboxylase